MDAAYLFAAALVNSYDDPYWQKDIQLTSPMDIDLPAPVVYCECANCYTSITEAEFDDQPLCFECKLTLPPDFKPGSAIDSEVFYCSDSLFSAKTRFPQSITRHQG